jgi:hypothetical protein
MIKMRNGRDMLAVMTAGFATENRLCKSKKCFVRIHCELALGLPGLTYSAWVVAVITGNCLFSMDFDCLIATKRHVCNTSKGIRQ